MGNAPDIRDQPDQHRFAALVDDEVAGFAEYRDGDGVRTFFHTEVEERFRGQGIAGRLIAGALDATRADGLGVEPECSFVRDHIAGDDSYLDLVSVASRAQYDL